VKDSSPSLNKYRSMSATEKAYVAGIVDGEGTIGIVREVRKENVSGYRFKPYFTVSNTDMKLLWWLQNTTGVGYIVPDGAAQRSRHDRRPLSRWRLTKRQLMWLLPQIKPYLVIKKEQAELAIKFGNLVVAGRRTAGLYNEMEPYWNKMKELNMKGLKSFRPVFREEEVIHDLLAETGDPKVERIMKERLFALNGSGG